MAETNLLIIAPESPKTDRSRCCIYSRSLKWLWTTGVPQPGSSRWSLDLRDLSAIMSQTHEIMVDPDHLIGPHEIINRWIRDYAGPYQGSLEFLASKVLELTQDSSGIWRESEEATPGPPTLLSRSTELVEWPLFSSSYGGDGITLKMLLGPRGLDLMRNR